MALLGSLVREEVPRDHSQPWVELSKPFLAGKAGLGRQLTPKLGRKLTPMPPLAAVSTRSCGFALAVSITGIPFLSALSITSPLCPACLVLLRPAPDEPGQARTTTPFARCCFVQRCI